MPRASPRQTAKSNELPLKESIAAQASGRDDPALVISTFGRLPSTSNSTFGPPEDSSLSLAMSSQKERKSSVVNGSPSGHLWPAPDLQALPGRSREPGQQRQAGCEIASFHGPSPVVVHTMRQRPDIRRAASSVENGPQHSVVGANLSRPGCPVAAALFCNVRSRSRHRRRTQRAASPQCRHRCRACRFRTTSRGQPS